MEAAAHLENMAARVYWIRLHSSGGKRKPILS